MLTEEEITNALRPLFSSEDAFSMALSMSMDEYRAIEQAVLEKLLKGAGEPYVWRAVGGSIWNHKTSEDDRALYTEDQVAAAVAKAKQEAPVQQEGTCPHCGSDCNERDELAKAEREIERLKAPVQQEPTLPEFFCGVDVDNNVISVSVLRRKPDGVAEVIHSEQIEIAAPVQQDESKRIAELEAQVKMLVERIKAAHDASLDNMDFTCRQILKVTLAALEGKV